MGSPLSALDGLELALPAGWTDDYYLAPFSAAGVRELEEISPCDG
jgi:hypothetical protein